MRSWQVALLILLAMWVRLVEADTVIQHVSVHAYNRDWQIKFIANQHLNYHQFSLTHPDRLVVDILHARYIGNVDQAEISRSPFQDIRSGHPRAHVLRFVFDLKTPVAIARIRPYELSQRRHELLLSLRPLHPYAVHSIAASSIKLAEPPVPEISNRPIIVLIDPGHGGKDPGATGYRGAHEKNVVLAISKDLQQMINHIPGFKAELTRTGDYYITLRGRLAIARRDHADMFIAIHADAYRNYAAHGASVFALSQRGATSEAARWLAQKENESELMGGVNLNNKSDVLRSVLIDLSQTATIDSSLRIGQRILNDLSTVAHLHHGRRVEQAAFVVLKSPDIPSLLVETGFISNVQEEQRLTNPNYQLALASAIEEGIVQYFKNYPPRGTWLAMKHNGSGLMPYHVQPGDSLLALARRFHTSEQRLRALNHLRHSRLLKGQILEVPV